MIDLSREPNKAILREKLDEITYVFPKQIPEIPNMIADLTATMEHTIEVTEDETLAHLELWQYTCFMYAFGLADSKVVKRIGYYLKNAFPSSEFVAFLISDYLTEILPADVLDGDIAVYSNPEKITHAGILSGGRVVSKWGDKGYLMRHALFELPAKYGDTIKFYRPISVVEIEQAFIIYAKNLEGENLIESLLAD